MKPKYILPFYFLSVPTASYQHSITTLSNSDYYDGVGMRNYGMMLTGGIKYVLRQ
jgi:hypothetical protein